MLVDDGDGILQDAICSGIYSSGGAVDRLVAVFMVRELVLVIAQLAEEAFAKIAAADAGRIELANDFEGFLEILGTEFSCVSRARWSGR
jgi:hypothetical protein